MADNNGWIASTDPTTGRTFYANRYTRTTQWDPPPGWNTPSPSIVPPPQTRSSSHNGSTTDNVFSDIAQARRQMETMGNNNGHQQQQQHHQQHKQSSHTAITTDPNALPDGWEEMSDPTTGRKFYIDHATKNTSWERPTNNTKSTSRTTSTNGGGSRNNNNSTRDDDTGFGNFSETTTPAMMMKLNQSGSHKRWDDDPHTGSRSSGYQKQQSYTKQHSYTSYTMGSSTSHAGPPPLDFVVVSVPDAMRMDCPGCYSPFTYTKRRHHCRLCGDVFCDACSSSRTILPLDGPEYATPVRVCDWCMKDVKRGNYFSLRRYLTPLQLFDPNKPMGSGSSSSKQWKGSLLLDDGGEGGSGEATKEITSATVAASLSSLSADIDAMINDPTSFSEKISIPASVLIPAVGKHLKMRETAEYAIRVLASLLLLGNVVGDDSFALAMYELYTDDDYGGGGMKGVDSTNSVISLSDGEDGSTSR
ncbi:hypothetical protein ACHAXR_001644, partial [Thalassiosira sp. AJA248-18]